VGRRGLSAAELIMGRPSDLPDFERPPVAEVVLSIQFAPLDKMRNFHIGLLWEKFRSQYPDVSEHGTINPAFEAFGAQQLQGSPPALRIEQFLTPPMPRYWFEKVGLPDLLQLQQDRIIHNWRKQETNTTYPRYEAIRARFENEVNTFVSFLKDYGLGDLKPNQCEVTYTNIIGLPDSNEIHNRLEQVTPLWAGKLSHENSSKESTVFAEIENTTIQFRMKLSEADKPVGRLHVLFQPGVLPADPPKEAVRLDITARGRPKQETMQAAFEFLDLGRRAVVKVFAAVTTPDLHAQWGRTDAHG